MVTSVAGDLSDDEGVDKSRRSRREVRGTARDRVFKSMISWVGTSQPASHSFGRARVPPFRDPDTFIKVESSKGSVFVCVRKLFANSNVVCLCMCLFAVFAEKADATSVSMP